MYYCISKKQISRDATQIFSHRGPDMSFLRMQLPSHGNHTHVDEIHLNPHFYVVKLGITELHIISSPEPKAHQVSL